MRGFELSSDPTRAVHYLGRSPRQHTPAGLERPEAARGRLSAAVAGVSGRDGSASCREGGGGSGTCCAPLSALLSSCPRAGLVSDSDFWDRAN